MFGCPCEKGDCANNGSCVVNVTTPLVNVCKCAGTWEGLRCERGEAPPTRGAAPREYFWYYKRTRETYELIEGSRCAEARTKYRRTTERLVKERTGKQTNERTDGRVARQTNGRRERKNEQADRTANERSVYKLTHERANDRINIWKYARTNERTSQLANVRTSNTNKLHERHERHER